MSENNGAEDRTAQANASQMALPRIVDRSRTAAGADLPGPALNGDSGETDSLLQLETLVPRLGEFLLEMGMLHREELLVALGEQQRRLRQGQPHLLGKVLLEMGYVDRATLDHALARQVMRLHDTLSVYNRRLEEEVAAQATRLERAEARVQRLEQHKDQFANIISHELRTPLTYILGYLDLFRMGDLGPVSAEQESALTQMQTAGDRLYQLINDLLSFAAYARYGVDLTLEPLLVSDLFKAVLRKQIEPARQQQIRLLVGLPQPQVVVVGDGKKIRWVLSELLENALKFTGRDGEISLNGRQRDGQRFEIAVKDSGPGIPPERQDEIFQPFHQLDGSITRRAGGIGLGLALAQKIIRAHGSQLAVTSRIGEGTRVGFSLPVYS